MIIMFMSEHFLPGQVSDIKKELIETTPGVTPFATWLLTKSVPATSANVSWIEQSVNENSAVTLAEGGDAPAYVKDDSQLMSNYLEIFAATATVSNTAQAEKAIGVDDLLAMDCKRKTQAIKMRANNAYINGVKSYNTATKTYHTGGIYEQINPANRVTGTVFDKNKFHEVLEAVYKAGANYSLVCFLPAKYKLMINNFDTVTIMARDKVLGFDTETFISPFGQVTFVVEDKCGDGLFVVNGDYLELATLLDFHTKDEPASGSKVSKYMEMQSGIKLLNSKAAASFKIETP